jgi:hypothetical protein
LKPGEVSSYGSTAFNLYRAPARVVVGSSHSLCRHSCDTGCMRALVLMGFMGNTPERDCFLELSVCMVSVALKPRCSGTS